MYNFIIKTISLCIVILFTACTSVSNNKLDEVYQIINDGNAELADMKFHEIPFASLKSDEERAYYKLIDVRLKYLKYIPFKSDNVIDYSLNYYRKVGNKVKEAECLFYKAQILEEYLDNAKEAIVYLKQAETIIKVMSVDVNLKHRIFESLTDINMVNANYEIALDYGLLNLEIAQQADNKNWLTYAYMLLMQVSNKVGDDKKESEYYRLLLENLKCLTEEDKVDFYNYLAESFIPGDLEKAARYAKQCIGTRNNCAGYKYLADIARIQGRYAEADSLYKQGMADASLQNKAAILYNLADMYSNLGDYKKAFEWYKEGEKVNEQIREKRKKNGIEHRQMEYDYQIKQLELEQNILYAGLAISMLTFGGIIIYVSCKYRYNRVMKEAQENQRLVEVYTKQMQELTEKYNERRQNVQNISQDDEKEKDQQIMLLEKRISELKGKQAEIMREGKLKYDEVVERGMTISLWTKNDFLRFIEYYKLIDPGFVDYLENSYDNLSPKHTFFEILMHIGKTDDDIMRIMGIGESAIRSIRSRIKAKRIA